MAKGILYICTTAVTGLIKIGRTDNFNSRMAILEQNGYWNVSGLQRYFAVKVDDYVEKEKLIHTIFSKSQVANSELFALDKELAKSVLESFEGEQIYPVVEVHKQIDNNAQVINQPKRKNRSPSTFEMLGISVGSELEYINNPSIKVWTVDNKNKVRHSDGTVLTISPMVCYIEGRDFPVNGNKCFSYNGKSL